MCLRIFSIFVVLFISTNAQTSDDEDGDKYTSLYDKMMSIKSSAMGLQELVNSFQSIVTDLEDVVSTQTAKIERLKEKKTKLEDKLVEMGGLHLFISNEFYLYVATTKRKSLLSYCLAWASQQRWTALKPQIDSNI